MSKKLLPIVLIILFSISNAYGAPPTTYDKKQDKKITQNKSDITTNKQDIRSNTTQINQNENDISSLNNNAVLYDNNRNVNLENNLEVQNNALIHGDLEVKGHIDPESIELIPQSIIPLENEGVIYYHKQDQEFKFRENGNWKTFGELESIHSDNADNITANANNILLHDNNITSNRLKNIEQDRRLDDHEDRIGELEETDVNIRGEVQFYRGKNVTMGVYGKYDIRHNQNKEVGLNIIIGIGESWEQKKITQIERKMKSLEKKLGFIGVEPKVEKTEDGWKMSISERDTMKVLKRF